MFTETPSALEARITVLLLVGPTAVGKSAVAAWVAERAGAEVISADARTIFRDLAVGTDRPPPDVLARVPHHLVGVLDPGACYDAAMFRRDCERIVSEIHARGRRAIVVGGSTLYVRALTRGLFPGPPGDPTLRRELAQRPIEELRAELVRADPEAARRIHPGDRVRLVRALEVCRKTGRPISSFWGQETPFPWPLVKVGLVLDRQEMYRRIEARVERMFAQGLVGEARQLWERGVPPESQVARTIGYRELFQHFAGEFDLAEAKRRIVRSTRAYARRQLAWFRAEEGVHWIDVTGRTVADVGGEVVRLWRDRDGHLQ